MPVDRLHHVASARLIDLEESTGPERARGPGAMEDVGGSLKRRSSATGSPMDPSHTVIPGSCA